MAAQLLADSRLASVPLTIHRDYGLPERAGENTFVIASSYSGNTEETLSAYTEARERGLSLVGVAAGGELEQRCATDGVPFVRIPADPPTMQPRSTTGYGLGILVRILETLGLAREGSVEAVERIGDALTNGMETARATGEGLVPSLAESTPVVYASETYRVAAHFWKIKFNENAKTPAFWHVFPELNHNEMVGWTNPHGSFHAIYLRAEDDHPRVLRRMEITRQLLQEKGVSGSIVSIEGNSLFERLCTTLLVGDWASYALALATGIDPSPVGMVEDLKKRLEA